MNVSELKAAWADLLADYTARLEAVGIRYNLTYRFCDAGLDESTVLRPDSQYMDIQLTLTDPAPVRKKDEFSVGNLYDLVPGTEEIGKEEAENFTLDEVREEVEKFLSRLESADDVHAAYHTIVTEENQKIKKACQEIMKHTLPLGRLKLTLLALFFIAAAVVIVLLCRGML